MFAKVHDGRDSIGVGDGSTLLFEVEFGKDVAREHRLVKEHLAALGCFVEANAWAEGLDVVKLPQVCGSDVLTLHFGAEGEPGGAIWEVIGGEVGRDHVSEERRLVCD